MPVEIIYLDQSLDYADMYHPSSIGREAVRLPLAMGCELLSLIIEHTDDDLVFTPERRAATFRSHIRLYRSSGYFGYSSPLLLNRLANDAQTIHKQRSILQERFATTIKPVLRLN